MRGIVLMSWLINGGDNYVLRIYGPPPKNTRAFSLSKYVGAGSTPEVGQYDLCIVAHETLPGRLDGAWHHVAAVVDSAQIRIYFDGVEQATTAPCASTTPISYNRRGSLGESGELWAGSHPLGNPYFDFFGNLDEVRVYRRALDAAAIRDLMRQGRQ
jgi:hypothetical protein